MEDSLEKRIFIITPVREITEDEKQFLDTYIAQLESQGYKVHFPPRDTEQTDIVGLDICTANREAIRRATEIQIYWNAKSAGSKFDFGMVFMAEKPITLINRDAVLQTPYKSFENVLLALDDKYREQKKA